MLVRMFGLQGHCQVAAWRQPLQMGHLGRRQALEVAEPVQLSTGTERSGSASCPAVFCVRRHTLYRISGLHSPHSPHSVQMCLSNVAGSRWCSSPVLASPHALAVWPCWAVSARCYSPAANIGNCLGRRQHSGVLQLCPAVASFMPLRYSSTYYRAFWRSCFLPFRRVAMIVRVLWSFVWFPANSAVAEAADAAGGNGSAAASSREDSGAGAATIQRRRRVRRET